MEYMEYKDGKIRAGNSDKWGENKKLMIQLANGEATVEDVRQAVKSAGEEFIKTGRDPLFAE